MLFLKAFAVGLVTGLVAPVVVGVAGLVLFLVAVLFSGYAATGVTGSFHVDLSPGWQEQLLKVIGVGFAIGFLFTLWRALVIRQAQ